MERILPCVDKLCQVIFSIAEDWNPQGRLVLGDQAWLDGTAWLSALPKEEIERRAVKAVSDFFAQKFSEVFADFGQSLQSQNSVERMRAFRNQITDNSGQFDHVIGGAKNQDLDYVDVLCQLQGARSDSA